MTTLTLAQRTIARDRMVQALVLGLHHAPAIHYTQDFGQRWEGIREHRVARKGQFPRHADCSAYYTWAAWNGLYLALGIKADVVNGEHWKAGYTGTLAQHGRQVLHESHLLPGDAVLYGPAPTFEHVAAFVGRKNGVPMVVSHGSENGPYLLPLHYRGDVGQFRRYILKELS
jgi:hypothetical protein